MADASALGADGATLGGSNPLLPIFTMMDKIAIMNQARLKKRRARDISVKEEALDLFEKNKKIPYFFLALLFIGLKGHG